MDSFQQCMEKLNTIFTLGHLTQAEYDRKRQALVDEFVGKPAARPVAPQATFAASPVRGFGFGGVPRGPMAFGSGAGFGAPRMAPMGMRGRGAGGAAFGGGFRYSPYPTGRSAAGSNAVKVQPLPITATADDLNLAFAQFGNIVLAVVKEGEPRHGFVNFSSPFEANKAAASGFVQVAGQVCQVSLSFRARPPVAEGAPTNGIGIFNIPFNMTYDQILAMLMAYPGFQNMKMVTRKTGEFRGYVFAYFDTVENASYAKGNLLGTTLGDQVLDVKFSNRPIEDVLQAQ